MFLVPMGNVTSIHPALPKRTIECLDLYDQRLKTEAKLQLKVAGVCKDLAGIVSEYVCCPREMLISVSEGYSTDAILYDLSINTRLVKLLPDFIECFHNINAPTGHTFTKPDIKPCVEDVVAARYWSLNPNIVHSYANHVWETLSPFKMAIRSALRQQSMYVVASLMPENAKGAISASGIFDGVFGDFNVGKQSKSAEAFPFFVEVVRRWSNNWSQFSMDDAIAFIGLHTENRTGQKGKAWELFQQVSPVAKASWVAARREDKTLGPCHFRARFYLTVDDAASLMKIKEFTAETAADWPKLKEKKTEKRKASSSKFGQGKKAKRQVDEFGCESSDGEYE